MTSCHFEVWKRLLTVINGRNLRSGVPFVFVGSGKERLIQLLDYSSVASPQSGLFSDWARNKRVLRTKP